MPLAVEDLIGDAIHRVHDELWGLSERRLEDPARVAGQLRDAAKRLEAVAVACELAAMQGEGVTV